MELNLSDSRGFRIIQDGPVQQRRQQQVVQTDPEADGDETASASASAAAASGGEGLDFRRSLGLGAVWHLAFLSLYQLYIVIALSLGTLQSFSHWRSDGPFSICDSGTLK